MAIHAHLKLLGCVVFIIVRRLISESNYIFIKNQVITTTAINFMTSGKCFKHYTLKEIEGRRLPDEMDDPAYKKFWKKTYGDRWAYTSSWGNEEFESRFETVTSDYFRTAECRVFAKNDQFDISIFENYFKAYHITESESLEEMIFSKDGETYALAFTLLLNQAKLVSEFNEDELFQWINSIKSRSKIELK